MPKEPQGGDGGIAPTHSQTRRYRGRVVSTKPRLLYPQVRSGSQCTGVCVDRAAGPHRHGKSHPHQDSILGPSSP
jgi:hypothetical protein